MLTNYGDPASTSVAVIPRVDVNGGGNRADVADGSAPGTSASSTRDIGDVDGLLRSTGTQAMLATTAL